MAVEGRSALLQACLESGGDLVASVEFLKSQQLNFIYRISVYNTSATYYLISK